MGGESVELTSILQSKGAGGMAPGATRVTMMMSSQCQRFKEGVVWALGTRPCSSREVGILEGRPVLGRRSYPRRCLSPTHCPALCRSLAMTCDKSWTFPENPGARKSGDEFLSCLDTSSCVASRQSLPSGPTVALTYLSWPQK